MKEDSSYPFYARVAFVLISLIALGYLMLLGQNILAPFFLGLLFAILLMPVSSFFERRLRFPRLVSAAVSVVMLVIGVSSIITLIGSQLSFVVREWPHLRLQLNQVFVGLQKWIETSFHIQATKQLSYLNELTSNALSASSAVVLTALSSFSSLLFFFIFTLLYTFFILLNRKRLVEFLVASFSNESSTVVYSIVHQVQYMIKKYVSGLFIEMCMVTVIAAILFWILGSRFVFLLALIVGIFNIIPYLGIFTAALLSALITFATATPGKALAVLIAVVLVHLLDSNILMPQILGSKVRINALIIIIGVVIGDMLWGVSGMFVAIPAIAILKIIFDHVDSLHPWAILLGDEEKIEQKPSSVAARGLFVRKPQSSKPVEASEGQRTT